jgi:hypothetical protein
LKTTAEASSDDDELVIELPGEGVKKKRRR